MRDESSKIESKFAGGTVGASSDRKYEKYLENVGNPSSQDSVVDDGQQQQHQQQQQYEKSKPASPIIVEAHGGRRGNLTIDHRSYKYGVGPASASTRACSSANVEGEANAAGFDSEVQQDLRGKLALEGLVAVTPSQQRPASLSASTSSRDRKERTSSSLVQMVEGAAEGKPVADQERMSPGSNGRFSPATDITTGITTTPSTSSREQHALRQDIISLAREDERETELLLLSTAEQEVEDTKQVGAAGAADLLGHHDDTILPANNPTMMSTSTSIHSPEGRRHHHQKQQSSGRANQKGYQETDFPRERHDKGVEIVLSPTSRPEHQASVAGGAKTRKVVAVDQLVVTASSLADTVESTLLLGGAQRTTNSNSTGLRGINDHNAGGWQHVSMGTPLPWSLLIHRCRLHSLMPVAGLLHHLNTLYSLEIDAILGGLALHGMERVLANASCLQTITLRRCGLTKLPCLKSGSVETLDISDNSIRTAAGLENLFRLKVLNMSGNNICRLMDVLPLVPLGAGCLRTLDLDRNPVQNSPRYEREVLGWSRNLHASDR